MFKWIYKTYPKLRNAHSTGIAQTFLANADLQNKVRIGQILEQRMGGQTNEHLRFGGER